MQKLHIVLAILGTIFARQCCALDIQLINGTQSACKLVHQTLLKGKVVGYNAIPWYIPAGTVATTFSIWGDFFSPDHGSEIELTYECGNNKKVTLSSKENACFLFTCDINAHIVERLNMNADYSISKGRYGLGGILSWVFTEN